VKGPQLSWETFIVFKTVLQSSRLFTYLESHPDLLPITESDRQLEQAINSSVCVDSPHVVKMPYKDTINDGRIQSKLGNDFVNLENDTDIDDDDDPYEEEKTSILDSIPPLRHHYSTITVAEPLFPQPHNSNSVSHQAQILPHESDSPSVTKISTADPSVRIGKARVIRPDGATIRDGIDIDTSNIIYKLKQGDVVEYDTVEWTQLSADDDDIVSVQRLHVTAMQTSSSQGKSEYITGWASLTGRTIDDMCPIFEILMHSNNRPTVEVYDLTTADDEPKNIKPVLLPSCPFCQLDLSIYSKLEVDQHMSACLSECF
jgi:hypothetical protein